MVIEGEVTLICSEISLEELVFMNSLKKQDPIDKDKS
jgi:hypothetical protein